MKAIIKVCDSISDWVGSIFAWAAIPIAIMVLFEVISRRIFNNPHMWALDICTLIYAIHFMMVGSFGLMKGAHVNVDTIYMHLSRRWQAGFDLAGYILFFFPYFIIFVYVGWDLSTESIMMGDKTVTGVPVIIPTMKTLIPVSAVLMLIAGIAQVLRCIYALINGQDINLGATEEVSEESFKT